jgi:hypothetical protein
MGARTAAEDQASFSFRRSLAERRFDANDLDHFPLFVGIHNIARKKVLLDQLEATLDVAGNIYEFGTWRGSTLVLLAEWARLRRPQGNKILFGFDAFEGLAPGTAEDGTARGRDTGRYRADEQALKELLAARGLDPFVRLVVGNVVDTVGPHFQSEPFNKVSFALMDMDLYEPTRAALEQVLPNLTGSASDVDSALVVHAEGQTLVNLNDCMWNEEHVAELRRITEPLGEEIDLLALGYPRGRALSADLLRSGARSGRALHEGRGQEAGVLRSLSALLRRLPGPAPSPLCRQVPARGQAGSAQPVPRGGGRGRGARIRHAGDRPHGRRRRRDRPRHVGGHGHPQRPYSQEALDARIREIEARPLDYETEIAIPRDRMAFGRLPRTALEGARRRSEVTGDYWFVIHVEQDDRVVESFQFSVGREATDFSAVRPSDALPEPRSEYFVDYRHLFGCLTGIYHRNNSEIGSFVRVRRTPNEFNRSAQSFLNFLSCA